MYSKITLATLLLISCTAKDVFSQKRLYARTHAEYQSSVYQPVDSIAYTYGGNRGLSAPKWNVVEYQMPFDSKNVFKYNSTSKVYDATNKSTATFDGSDRITKVLVEKNSSGTWSNDQQLTFTYSTNLDTVLYQNWSTMGGGSFYNSSRNIYTFSGANPTVQLVQRYSFGGGGGGGGSKWKNSRQYNSSYNSGGYATTVVTQVWNGSAWEDTLKVENTYDGSNNLTQVLTYTYTTTWVNNLKSIYTYTSGQLQTLEVQYWDGTSSKWLNKYKNSYAYSGTNLSTLTRQDFDQISSQTYINTQKSNYNYYNVNPYNVTEFGTESWNGTAWLKQVSVDSMERFYYAGSLGVNTVAQSVRNINVYPSPASNLISFELANAQTGEIVNVKITNMAGVVVRSLSAVSQNKMQVSVADLPAANYLITVQGKEFISTQRFTVSR